MKRTALLSILPAALSLAVAVPATANAATATSFSQVIGSVQLDPANPERAFVTARYRCTGEAHLWVSVKQTAGRNADQRLTAEGSSAISASWSDSHRNSNLVCDGTVRVDRFEVDQEEPVWGQEGPKSQVYAPLAPGAAYVQFCLYDETTGEGGASDNAFRGVA